MDGSIVFLTVWKTTSVLIFKKLLSFTIIWTIWVLFFLSGQSLFYWNKEPSILCAYAEEFKDINRKLLGCSKQIFSSCKRACALTEDREKDTERVSERERGVFTRGCVTPPVSGDLQERSCCSLTLPCSVSFICVLFSVFSCFVTSEMNCFSRCIRRSVVYPSTKCQKTSRSY